jgi:hypothetical protein
MIGTGGSLYQFQIKDDLKAARIEAARRTEEYVEQPKTSQRREGLDMELELALSQPLPYHLEQGYAGSHGGIE